MNHALDRLAGRAYARLLSVILAGVALLAIALGIVIAVADSVQFAAVWLAAGLFFGYVARRLWRSRASLRETFRGHG